jgi:hypothetical protein
MNLINVVGPFALIAVIIFVVVGIYFRQGRNHVLEELIKQDQVASIATFRGTLAVEESRAGSFLRLRKDSDGRRLQFQYRWFIGVGRQAIFDEVVFDGLRRYVELTESKKHAFASFSEFSAIRMREVAGKHVSIWHVELVPNKATPLLFLTSERGDRQTSFVRTGSVAKAISAIMSIPVQVVVDGKVWTPGWPPKNSHQRSPERTVDSS